jgi:signal transduction histidine kinase
MACNADGVWNTAGAAIVVTVLPHYYETLWFRALLALAVIAGVSGIVRFVTVRRMRRQMELLEQRHAIERERGRIARDIHDDLGSSLTRIMMLGERTQEGLGRREDVATHVNKIVASARHTVQSLDEIVWAVDPENDTLEGLVNYIAHYADEFFESAAINCRLEIPVALPGATLPAEWRHDLFLVVKEAFNNAVKHAGASAVRVEVACQDGQLMIAVEDNGCGFDPSVRNGHGCSGLANMRQRVEHLGGHFQLSSAPGSGTQARLAVPLARAQSANGNGSGPLI